jgi:hypothetical protein
VDGALSSSGPKMILNWTTLMINLFVMLKNLSIDVVPVFVVQLLLSGSPVDQNCESQIKL